MVLSTPSFLKFIMSPTFSSREGFAFLPQTFTFLERQASVAKVRVLKNLVAQSHLSILGEPWVFLIYFRLEELFLGLVPRSR